MMNSLRKKYIFFGFVLIICFLLLMIGISRVLKESLVSQWNRSRMEGLAKKTIQELNDNDWDISRGDIDAIAFEGNAYITVVDEDMNILMSTRVWEASRGHLDRKPWKLWNRIRMSWKKKEAVFSVISMRIIRRLLCR